MNLRDPIQLNIFLALSPLDFAKHNRIVAFQAVNVVHDLLSLRLIEPTSKSIDCHTIGVVEDG